jgi:hypothetical protein
MAHGHVDSVHDNLVQDNTLRVALTPGFGSTGGGGPPFRAGWGELFVVSVRYTEPGTYVLSLPQRAGDHYNVDSIEFVTGTARDWSNYAGAPPGLDSVVTVT